MSLLEDLVAAGVPEEYSKACKKVIDNSFVPKERFNEVVSERHDLQSELDRIKLDFEAKESLVTRLSGDIKELKQAAKAREMQSRVESELMLMGVRNPEVVMKLIDMKALKVGEDNSVSGLTEQLDTWKAKAPELFGGNEPAQPQQQGKPTELGQTMAQPQHVSFAGYKPVSSQPDQIFSQSDIEQPADLKGALKTAAFAYYGNYMRK